MTTALVTGGVTVTALCPGPTASVAAYGAAAMRKGDAVAVPGTMNKVFASSIRVTPRPIVRRVVHRVQSTGG